MLRNRHLAKAIQSVSWNIFVKMLEYKAEDAGRNLVKIDRFYPSSKLCHHCGYKNENLQLKDRSWSCPQCGNELDRDINASINILNEGLKLLNHRAYGDSLCKLEINTEIHREPQQILLKRNV
jgi:putative transposase